MCCRKDKLRVIRVTAADYDSDVRGSTTCRWSLIAAIGITVLAVERQLQDLASTYIEGNSRRPLIQKIDTLEHDPNELDVLLSDPNQIEKPQVLIVSSSDLVEIPETCRADHEGGTMDKRQAVFRQLIESAVFDGEEWETVPTMAIITGTGVKVASPRGFEPLLPP